MERFEHSVLDLDFQQLAAWWELGRGGSKGQRGGVGGELRGRWGGLSAVQSPGPAEASVPRLWVYFLTWGKLLLALSIKQACQMSADPRLFFP